MPYKTDIASFGLQRYTTSVYNS